MNNSIRLQLVSLFCCCHGCLALCTLSLKLQLWQTNNKWIINAQQQVLHDDGQSADSTEFTQATSKNQSLLISW